MVLGAMQRVKVRDKVLSYITLLNSGCGYYRESIRIKVKKPCSVDIIHISRKIQILWILLPFCGFLRTLWILSAFRGNIQVMWILSAFRGYICILWILSALTTL